MRFRIVTVPGTVPMLYDLERKFWWGWSWVKRSSSTKDLKEKAEAVATTNPKPRVWCEFEV